MVKKGFDLFPQTLKTAKYAVLINGISSSHVETVVLLSREKVDGYIGITFDVEKLGQIPHTPLPEPDTPPVKVVRKTYGRASASFFRLLFSS